MKNRLKITESQLERLKVTINEGEVYSKIVKEMKDFLDRNYEPISKFVREGGEYFETPMIMIKADEEVITPKALYEYLKSKYKKGDAFTKQVIQDWVHGGITDEYHLTKNVALSEDVKILPKIKEGIMSGYEVTSNDGKTFKTLTGIRGTSKCFIVKEDSDDATIYTNSTIHFTSEQEKEKWKSKNPNGLREDKVFNSLFMK